MELSVYMTVYQETVDYDIRRKLLMASNDEKGYSYDNY